MSTRDPLQEFEQLTACLAQDRPPRVRVAAQVARRIRSTQSSADRTFALLAAGSCAAALAVALIGFVELTQLTDPLSAVFDIMPPIGL